MKMPALLTSVSIRPNREIASLTTRFGGRRIADVAADRHDVLIAGLLDRAGGRHDPIVAIPKRLDQAGADALRSAGDDGHFLLAAHD